MGMHWTQEQQKVIWLRDRNILVSAAAGSGKTAVLVERIIQMLTDKDHPADVDRLLIVTFTEAAAAEMKERIRNAIEAALEQRPEDVHLQRQATLIHSAKIMTIHSFCLSVIKEHFHVIGLDPGFRIAEEGELKLLKHDVLDTLLEEKYASEEKEFLDMTEKLAGGRNDKKLEELVLQLYEYSRSYPMPGKWLDDCAGHYHIPESGEAEIFIRARDLIGSYLADLPDMIRQGLKICGEPDGPYMYTDMLEEDLQWIQKAAQAENFEELYACLSEIKWKRMSAKKDDAVSMDKREQVKKLREQIKKQVKNIQESYLYEEPDELKADMELAYSMVQTFTSLVKEFATAFAQEKADRNLIDFGDMEQFALQILTTEENGVLVPSMAAGEYQEQFTEVMIDEYQDSNLIQEAILTSVSMVHRGKNNIFMVGDVKQSIYRFRMSRPELFMEKYDTYTTGDSSRQRIDLHKNFRSRSEVLDCTNYIFRRIMRKELGGICYDDQAALYPGAEFEPYLDEDGSSIQTAELLLLDTEPDDKAEDPAAEKAVLEEDERQTEARMIAERIKKLRRTGKVKDKETGKPRAVKYSDIVILTRSVKGWADVFVQILGEEGIPAYAGSREGYFETYEIRILLDYLKLLDNQRQDLPLAAVLASPFVGLDAQQMAEIRAAFPETAFYEAAELCAAKEEGKQSSTEKKLSAFYEILDQFRDMSTYMPIHELLWKILEETGYGLFIEAMPGGAQRKANVEMLVEKAAAFEGTSYKGLFNFVRYMEQLDKYDVDYGEANIAGEQADVVRVMSIHKSKGLEFPVVFVAGMGKQFNMQDVNSSIVIHPEFGIGVDAVDLEHRTKIPTFLKKIMQQQIKIENLGEELRVLYVAMTRAKEKLILTGRVKGFSSEEQFSREAENIPLPFYVLAGAHTYLDWILPAVAKEDAPVKIEIHDPREFALQGAVEEQAEAIARETLEHWNVEQTKATEISTHLEEQFSYRYPYEREGRQKLKFTVSELKKRAYMEEEAGEITLEEPDVIPLIPQFLQEEEVLTGASRGSAYHKLLELLDFRKTYEEDSLQEEIDRLRGENRIAEDMAACIRNDDILTFLRSNAGRRMTRAAKSGHLYKEQPFVLGVDAGVVYPQEAEEEMILVQGIIDVYFEEDGELVVLDYKTDRVRTASELTEKYHAQLEYYAKALEQLLQKPVKEKIIYSFTLGKEIIL